MNPLSEIEECLLDTPEYRAILESSETDIEVLEVKLEKVTRLFSQAADAGRGFVSLQSSFLAALQDLGSFLESDSRAVGRFALSLAAAYREMLLLQTSLIEESAKAMCSRLGHFLKTDIRHVKESKQHLDKISAELDGALLRNGQVSRSRLQECVEANHILMATRSCFQHTGLDHMAAVSSLQSRKRHEIVNLLAAFLQAHATYFREGHALWKSAGVPQEDLDRELAFLRAESAELKRNLEERHHLVSRLGVPVRRRHPELLAGYLFKRASNAFKTWHRRWFALYEDRLTYRKRTGNDGVTVLEEDLRLCNVRACEEADRRHCFELLSPSKCHLLQADSEDACQTWMAALQQAISRAFCQRNGAPERQGTLARGGSQLSLRSIPGNGTCGDCGAPSPEWASINIGVTLCIECSGIHRSLGVHVSKVRSLLLDSWEQETRKVFAELGNVLVNSVYEAKIGTEGRRIGAEREAWIRAKYIDRSFVPDGVLPEGAVRHAPQTWCVRRRRRSRKKRRRKDQQPPDPRPERPGGLLVFDGCCRPQQQQEDDDEGEREEEEDDNEEEEEGEDCDSMEGGEEEEEEEGATAEERSIDSLSANALLWQAAGVPNLPVMCLALALGADRNWADPDGGLLSVLHRAVRSGSATACQYLLLNGSRYDVIDGRGRSPLLLACSLGHVRQVCLLLKYRANQHLPDAQQRTPLSVAIQRADANIVTLLRLAQLDDHMREDETQAGGDDTFQEVVRDFAQLAPQQQQE